MRLFSDNSDRCVKSTLPPRGVRAKSAIGLVSIALRSLSLAPAATTHAELPGRDGDGVAYSGPIAFCGDDPFHDKLDSRAAQRRL
jgi:hypothetical protein